MTQKDLIKSLRELRKIEPRKEWAVLLKSQILESQVKKEIVAEKVNFWSFVRNMASAPKFAYSLAGFAALVLVAGGLWGNSLLWQKHSVAGVSVFKEDVIALGTTVKSAAEASKTGNKENIPAAMKNLTANASQLTQGIKSKSADQQDLKLIGTALKVLADVSGTDLAGDSSVKNLYQTLVEEQLTELKKTTLTTEQEKALLEAEKLYNNKEYVGSLERILTINQK